MDFNCMMTDLRFVQEVALDVEHHDYRSFKGFVCLVQITINGKDNTMDFVVDAISLKDEMHRLNKVTSNGNVLKVLHGGDRDIEWLQRDFGIYFINMFDTQKAAKLLQEPNISLSAILNKYCTSTGAPILTEKQSRKFKRTDWRLRPLSKEMLRYVREDTHFLLYVYDLFRERLLKKGVKQLKQVYTQSTSLCAFVYEEPEYTYLMGISNIKGARALDERQTECFRLLYELRLEICRRDDESIGYVLPNKLLLRLSKTLPQSEEEVRDYSKGYQPLPYMVQNNMQDIVKFTSQDVAPNPV